jgi:hypothetical protein
MDTVKELWQRLLDERDAEFWRLVEDRKNGVIPLKTKDWEKKTTTQTVKLNDETLLSLKMFCAKNKKSQQEAMETAIQIFLWAQEMS